MNEEIKNFHLNQWESALKHYGKLAMTKRLLQQLLPNTDDRQNWENKMKGELKCTILHENNKIYFTMPV